MNWPPEIDRATVRDVGAWLMTSNLVASGTVERILPLLTLARYKLSAALALTVSLPPANEPKCMLNPAVVPSAPMVGM